MKQRIFTEAIASLIQGDIIRVSHTDVEMLLPEGTYEATVMGVERVGTFGFKALLNIASYPELVQTKRFDLTERFELLSWESKPAVSVNAENLEAGDTLTVWGHDILVQSVIPQITHQLIATKDLVTGEEHVKLYQNSDRLLYKRRDLNEKEIKGIFEHMAPPISYDRRENPEDIAKRIIRHAEEWTE